MSCQSNVPQPPPQTPVWKPAKKDDYIIVVSVMAPYIFPGVGGGVNLKYICIFTTFGFWMPSKIIKKKGLWLDVQR